MKALSFSDILIVPQYSEVESRSDVLVSADLHNDLVVGLPVISANMKHITGPKMAMGMRECGGLGILHRYNTIEDAVSEFKSVTCQCGVSIGVKELDKERFDSLHVAGARIFCIDVAHGHHVLVKKMLKWLKDSGTKDQIIIAGNIATKEAALDLQEWGADILKVGIGPGKICVTRRNVGVGVPQFSAIMDVASVSKVPIISDGGINYSGDVSKALIYADAVMVGNYIAGTTETPGKVYRDENNTFYKVYGGSSAGENKNANGQKVEFVEGIMKTVKFQGHVKYLLKEIKHGLQSAFSYSGASNLKEFQAKVKWVEISEGSRIESKI